MFIPYSFELSYFETYKTAFTQRKANHYIPFSKFQQPIALLLHHLRTSDHRPQTPDNMG